MSFYLFIHFLSSFSISFAATATNKMEEKLVADRLQVEEGLTLNRLPACLRVSSIWIFSFTIVGKQ